MPAPQRKPSLLCLGRLGHLRAPQRAPQSAPTDAHVCTPTTRLASGLGGAGSASSTLLKAIIDPLADISPIRALLAQGCDLEADLVPIVAREVPELPRPLKR